MKKLIILAASLLMFCAPWLKAEADVDFSVLEGMAHPRLFVSAADLEDLNKAVAERRSETFMTMHKAVIAKADKMVKENKTLVFKKDDSNRRILTISRDALAIIFACSYAYRTTGDEKYLRTVDYTMNTVCDFETWNPTHFLDVAEMGLAVAIGYDWLYDVLPEETRVKAAQKMYDYAMVTTLNPKYSSWSNGVVNWNQVCHAGGVAVALALYEQHPEEAQKIILRAIPSNLRALKACYAPEGIYPEGPGYWSYGTSFQIALNTLLQRAFGTDFGLSDSEGFDKTGKFLMWCQGNAGLRFDYSDASDAMSDFPEGWYFAWRFNDPNQLYLNDRAIRNGKLKSSDRMLPLDVVFAARYDGKPVPAPSERVFTGKGHNPVLIARTGWENDDLYLGIKAGRGGINHGHLDVGSFIYEADGVRWACEIHYSGGYAVLEKALKPVGGSLFNTKPESWRWKIFSFSNTEHNTLTVNGKIHNPMVTVDIAEVIDEENRIGGSMDLTPLFDGDVASAVRTAVIRDDSYLEVTDVIKGGDAPAKLRWTMVTKAVPELMGRGVLLTAGDKQMMLSVKGAKVKYRTWSTDPADYPNEVNSILPEAKRKAICGYEVTVPAGKTVTLVTTLKKY